MTPHPAWFQKAIDFPRTAEKTVVAGCQIHFQTWGDPGKPGLLLVHGGLAHVDWWRFIAPFFADSHRVAALDLSGHGASGRRNPYSVRLWLDEILAVCEQAGFRGAPVLAGHSMGGLLSMALGLFYPERWRAVIINDAPVHNPFGTRAEGERGKSYRHIKPYADLASAKSRFRYLPAQPCANEYITDFLAESSLKRVDDGWIWKFDPIIFEELETGPLGDLPSKLACPAAFIRGEYSKIVPAEIAGSLRELGTSPIPLIEVPDAHHHIMIDQPLAFITALRTLLAAWQAAG